MELTLRPRQKTDYKLLNEGESLSIRKTLQNSTPVVLDGTFNVERLIHRKKEKGSHVSVSLSLSLSLSQFLYPILLRGYVACEP